MRWLRAAVLVVGLGCSSHRGGAVDAAGDASADVMDEVDGGCAAATRFACIYFACCNDEGTQAVCVNGEWMCPEGSIDLRTCPGFVGGPPPPGCDCTEAGVVCPTPADASVGDAAGD